MYNWNQSQNTNIVALNITLHSVFIVAARGYQLKPILIWLNGRQACQLGITNGFFVLLLQCVEACIEYNNSRIVFGLSIIQSSSYHNTLQYDVEQILIRF